MSTPETTPNVPTIEEELLKVKVTGGPQGFDTLVEIFDHKGNKLPLDHHIVGISFHAHAGRQLSRVTLELGFVELDADIELESLEYSRRRSLSEPLEDPAAESAQK